MARPPYPGYSLLCFAARLPGIPAAGAAVLADKGADVRVSYAVFGEMVDMGVKDANNMGSAMAPADVILNPYIK